MSSRALHIAVGVLVNADGAILIAQRAEDAHQGGLWEFPGGKVEAGEAVLDALRRELAEEIGIEVTTARPFMRTEHAYLDRRVLLDVWQVESWCGQARGCEGQPIAWVPRHALPGYAFPEADRPIVTALRLPPAYLITPEIDRHDSHFFERLDACLKGGIRLVQFRAKHMLEGQYMRTAEAILRVCNSHDAALILNSTPMTALQLGAHGVHLPSARLLQLQQRPLPAGFLVGASCHNAMEIAHATAIDADFCLISPVFETTSHPEAQPIGWDGFRSLAQRTAMPAFALGGLHPLDLPTAWQHGAYGVAMISGLWDAADPCAAAAACTELAESRPTLDRMYESLQDS